MNIQPKKLPPLSVRQSAFLYLLISLALAAGVFFLNFALQQEMAANNRMMQKVKLSGDLVGTANYLSREARAYIQHRDERHLARYWGIVKVDKTRDKIYRALVAQDLSSEEFEWIGQIQKNSGAFVFLESRAMRLVAEGVGIPESQMHPELAAFRLDTQDRELTQNQKFLLGKSLLFDPRYEEEMERLKDLSSEFQNAVHVRYENEIQKAKRLSSLALFVLIALAIAIPILLSYDLAQRNRAERALLKSTRIATLGAEVGAALTGGATLQEMLQQCVEAIVRNLDAAFARIWTLNAKESMLELQASAGMYTHLDGAHSRVPVGQLKIGLIAQERKPHFTNDVIRDPRISDREWARREKMIAFAGHPLIVENRLIGVVALFSRYLLSPYTVEAMGSVADEIAIGIERKRSESALRESEEKSRLIIETAGDAFIAIDDRGLITEWNRQAELIFGWPRQEAIGKPLHEVVIPHNQRESYHKGFARFLETGEGPILQKRVEVEALHRDGHLFPVELMVWPSRVAGVYQCNAFVHDITARKQAEEKLRKTNEELVSHQKKLMEALSELRKAHMELQNTQSRLIQSEKFATIGRLAGMISHEFRNELGVMRNAAYFLKMRLKSSDEKVQRNLDILEERIQETDRIIENIMTFAKTAQPQLSSQDVGRLLRATVGKVKIPANIKVVIGLESDLPRIQADEIQLTRAFLNVILNAVQAMQEKEGELRVTANREKDYVRILISDTGPGIKEADKQHLFEPLFTTKPRGAGLGLATAQLLIESHDGTIDIESQIGKGTTVGIRLPFE